jgi:hypothetical protein
LSDSIKDAAAAPSAVISACEPRYCRAFRFDPAQAAAVRPAEALAVAFLQPQADRQVGCPGVLRFVHSPLYVLQQFLRLPAFAGELLAFLLQAFPFAFQRVPDALVDVSLARPQTFVLGPLFLAAFERVAQFGAQLLHLTDQGRHGIARGIALDPQGFHLFRDERADGVRRGGLARSRNQPETNEDHQREERNQQPFEQRITLHGRLPAWAKRKEKARAPAAAIRRGHARG